MNILDTYRLNTSDRRKEPIYFQDLLWLRNNSTRSTK